ncbi:hypothetical protein GLOTRDRAFT_129727 [Gloeophyllum trabeum ATCC 11539]|uniref:Uncharacterized protein n=1 Tax=Gloeophyllum trabeum (strain ATCC 11539 / FP-39264 / Madison 617) TaxID=670483 RepID=S7Q7K2_GLOTA|nr:uncharacterized protein GLOTRDRAFT_129727 [Gloeophyllum trabeum ATCC 11539]EPQ55453.1 hypothetical protein GLOTRDRAFT_129727 [Gloeophyllum trabeum ATCC 11539]
MELNTRLANSLQLLRCFWLSKLHLPRGVVPSLEEEEVSERDLRLTLLNDVATLLCTGENGRSLAVTMENTEDGLRLTLATAAYPLDSEREAADKLFRLLQDEKTNMESLFNTAVCSGMERVKRFIEEVKKNLELFPLMSLIDEVKPWRRCEEEIPMVSRARELCGAEISLPPADLLKRLFIALREQINSLVGIITPETIRDTIMLAQVYRVSCLCDIVGRSRFFRRVTRLNHFEPFSHHAASLMSALLVLGRYSGAATRLSKRVRNIRQPISYVWDTAIAAPPAPKELVLHPTAYEALRAGDYVEATSGEERDADEAMVESEFKDASWENRVTVFLHPELRLILLAKDTTERILGISDDLCFSCKRWIEYYNESTERKWIVRPGLDVPDPTWMYPQQHPLEQQIEPLVSEWTDTLVHFRLGGLTFRRALLLW